MLSARRISSPCLRSAPSRRPMVFKSYRRYSNGDSSPPPSQQQQQQQQPPQDPALGRDPKYRDIGFSSASGPRPSIHLFTRTQKMAHHFARGRPELGDQVFNQLVESGVTPDEIAWTTVLNGWADAGRLDKVQETIERMQKEGAPITLYHWGCLMKALIDAGQWKDALARLQALERDGPKPDLGTYNVLLLRLARKGFAQECRAIFKRISSVAAPDASSYHGLLQAEAQVQNFDEAQRLMQRMRELGMEITHSTLTTLIKHAFVAGRLDLVDTYRTELGDSIDVPLAVTLLKGYMKTRQWAKANAVVEQVRANIRGDEQLYLEFARFYCTVNRRPLILAFPDELKTKKISPQGAELGALVIETAVSLQTAEEVEMLLRKLWDHRWIVPLDSVLKVVDKLKQSGKETEAGELKKEAEERYYNREARRMRREVLQSSQGRPLYTPKVNRRGGRQQHQEEHQDRKMDPSLRNAKV